MKHSHRELLATGEKFDWDVQQYYLNDAMSNTTPSTYTITLDTPVPVGESFTVVTSANSGNYGSTNNITAELKNVVSGNYTEVLVRSVNITDWQNHYVIQVITSPFFHVQVVVDYTLNDTNEPFTLSFSTAIDQNKTFICSQISGGAQIDRSSSEVYFASNTSITIDKDTSFGEDIGVVLYVVEIKIAGASVEYAQTTMTGTSASVSPPNSTSDTWVLYTFRTGARDGADTKPFGEWDGSNNFDLSRVSGVDYTAVSAFYITIPGLFTERVVFNAGDFTPRVWHNQSISSATEAKTLINPMCQNYANSKPSSTGLNIRSSMVALKQTSSTNVQYWRTADDGSQSLTINFEVVTLE